MTPSDSPDATLSANLDGTAVADELTSREFEMIANPEMPTGPWDVLIRREACKTAVQLLTSTDDMDSRVVMALLNVLSEELRREPVSRAASVFDIDTISEQICRQILEGFQELNFSNVSTLKPEEIDTIFEVVIRGSYADQTDYIRHLSFELLVDIILARPSIIQRADSKLLEDIVVYGTATLEPIEEVPQLVLRSDHRPTEYYVLKLIGTVLMRRTLEPPDEASCDALVEIGYESGDFETQIWALLIAVQSDIPSDAVDFDGVNLDEMDVDSVIQMVCDLEPDLGVDYYDDVVDLLIDFTKLGIIRNEHSGAVVQVAREIIERPPGMFRFVSITNAGDLLVSLDKRNLLRPDNIHEMRDVLIDAACNSIGSYGELEREVVCQYLDVVGENANTSSLVLGPRAKSLQTDLNTNDSDQLTVAIKGLTVIAASTMTPTSDREATTQALCNLLIEREVSQRRTGIAIKEVADFGTLTDTQATILLNAIDDHIQSPCEDVTNFVLDGLRHLVASGYVTSNRATSLVEPLCAALDVEDTLIRNSTLSVIRSLHEQGLLNEQMSRTIADALCELPAPGSKLWGNTWFELLRSFAKSDSTTPEQLRSILETLLAVVDAYPSHAGFGCQIIAEMIVSEMSVTPNTERALELFSTTCFESAAEDTADGSASRVAEAYRRLIEAGVLSDKQLQEVIKPLCQVIHECGERASESAVDALEAVMAAGLDPTAVATELLPLEKVDTSPKDLTANRMFNKIVPRTTSSVEQLAKDENAEKWEQTIRLLDSLVSRNPDIARPVRIELERVLREVAIDTHSRIECVSILVHAPTMTEY